MGKGSASVLVQLQTKIPYGCIRCNSLDEEGFLALKLPGNGHRRRSIDQIAVLVEPLPLVGESSVAARGILQLDLHLEEAAGPF